MPDSLRIDLIIVQSNESAYKYNQSGGDNRNPLYAYWKYNKPSVILKDEKGKVIEPNKGGQAVYEGSISEDNGNSWKSMDMQWDAALAVLDRSLLSFFFKYALIVSVRTSVRMSGAASLSLPVPMLSLSFILISISLSLSVAAAKGRFSP